MNADLPLHRRLTSAQHAALHADARRRAVQLREAALDQAFRGLGRWLARSLAVLRRRKRDTVVVEA